MYQGKRGTSASSSTTAARAATPSHAPGIQHDLRQAIDARRAGAALPAAACDLRTGRTVDRRGARPLAAPRARTAAPRSTSCPAVEQSAAWCAADRVGAAPGPGRLRRAGPPPAATGPSRSTSRPATCTSRTSPDGASAGCAGRRLRPAQLHSRSPRRRCRSTRTRRAAALDRARGARLRHRPRRLRRRLRQPVAPARRCRSTEVKIDRAFVAGVAEAGEDREVVALARSQLAHGLGLTVIAEGVETARGRRLARRGRLRPRPRATTSPGPRPGPAPRSRRPLGPPATPGPDARSKVMP